MLHKFLKKGGLKNVASELDELLAKRDSAKEEQIGLEQAIIAAQERERAAEEAFQAEKNEVLRARLEVMVAEMLGAVAEERDEALHQVDEWLRAGEERFLRLEVAETRLRQARDELVQASHEMAGPENSKLIAIPSIPDAFRSVGLMRCTFKHGANGRPVPIDPPDVRHRPSGGRLEVIKTRRALLFVAGEVEL